MSPRYKGFHGNDTERLPYSPGNPRKQDDRSRIGILNRCLLPACGTVEAYADGGKSDPRRKQASVMYRSGKAEKAS